MTTPDGVRIACDVSGRGTPLIMVHGAGSARWGFDLVRPHLEDAFELWVIDRRGRGDSADADSYAIEREFDDVAAVVREAGEGALLFGHSYGGLVAAGAAGRLDGLPRLVVYEGPMGGVLADEDFIARFEANLAAGRVDEAVSDFLRDVGGYTDAEVEAMKGAPTWQARIAAAPAVPRELRAERALATADLELERLQLPTLILVGSDSPDWAKRSTAAYAEAIPNAELHTLSGQGHGAAVGAPELLAGELRAFLSD